MENVKLINIGSYIFGELASGKKIKVSNEKLQMLRSKTVEEEKVEEVQVDRSFEEQMPVFKKPDFTLDSSFLGSVMGVPSKVEPEMASFDVPVTAEKKEVSVVKPGEYVVPDIKGPNNVSVARVDRSEEFRKMLDKVDSNTVVGRVLASGVSKLDENMENQAKIKAYIEELDVKISKLEKARDSILTGKQDIEDLLSKTTQISLAEIREAASLNSSERANRELEKIKESIGNIKRIKDEATAELSELEVEREKLESERAQQKTRLMSAERSKTEICDSIEKDLGTATQIERLEKEQEQLRSKLSLVGEEPKKVVSITNPFEKMRVMEEEVESETMRRAA